MNEIKTEQFDQATDQICADNAETLGTVYGVSQSAINYADNVIFGACRGHGFAAERANHLKDILSGKDATLVGGNNIKNGADRLVDGVSIQTKYCKTGSRCIRECFENNKFRYLNADGKPMQIEVPSDKYDSAIQAMEDRIKNGEVPGVSDPEMAKNIVRKGSFTYAQAKNIAKFGTIESLTYDTLNGIKLAGTAMGISSAISFAVGVWNGESLRDSIEGACYTGLKVGGVTWIGSIIAAQLGRTGAEKGLKSTTDWAVKKMGAKAAAWLVNGLREGSSIYGIAAMNHLSKLLRGNIMTGFASTLVISSVDFVRMFQGRVSGAQVFKNVATTASGVAGGTGGWMAGAAGGAALGSAVPVIGTVVGGIVGGILGMFAGSAVASKTATVVLDVLIEDDAKEMIKVVEHVFGRLAFDYLLNEKEAEEVLDQIKSKLSPDFIRRMFAARDHFDFAQNELKIIIEKIAIKRKIIQLPTEDQIIEGTGKVINDIISNLSNRDKNDNIGEILSEFEDLSTDVVENKINTVSPKYCAEDCIFKLVNLHTTKPNEIDRKINYAICLINLMNADGVRHSKELKFIDDMIMKFEFDPITLDYIRDLSTKTTLHTVQYDALMRDGETPIRLLLDLIVLAKRDGYFSERERRYILEIGDQLGFAKESIERIMDF